MFCASASARSSAPKGPAAKNSFSADLRSELTLCLVIGWRQL